MENKQTDKKELFLYKINKTIMIAAPSVAAAEEVFKKHQPNGSIVELKKMGTVLM